MQNLISALLLTLSALNPFGSTVQSGQSIISSQTTTVENQSQIVTQVDLERNFYQRISQVRPWFPTPTPPTPPGANGAVPSAVEGPTPPAPPTPPTFPTPVLASPTPTPIIIPTEFNRLEMHRL